jgi:serine O-acetyltransferase
MTTALNQVARELTDAGAHSTCAGPPPSLAAVQRCVGLARSILFQPYLDCGGDHSVAQMTELLEQLRAALRPQVLLATGHLRDRDDDVELEDRSTDICDQFMARLPALQQLLETDVQAAVDSDPALEHPEEAVLCYPGVMAMLCHRIAHALHVLGTPLLPRMIMSHAHAVTGIDIHPQARIGARFFIDHGSGVVIGATAEVGDGVRIYQGVTLGAKSFPVDKTGRTVKGLPRHPIVEDDVVIYSGATVLGRITIGRGAVIGGNVWVTRDVAPEGRVTQATPVRRQFAHGDGI